jgi:hypothetical protein
LDCAKLQGFQFLLVLVEGGVGIDLNFDPAVGVLLSQFLEFVGCFALRRIGGDHVTEFDHDRRLR